MYVTIHLWAYCGVGQLRTQFCVRNGWSVACIFPQRGDFLIKRKRRVNHCFLQELFGESCK
ncbi:hypothetical protein Desgi_1633 [Desulfoscipio gibsoniae DSM 7213]|uniref:Uncharacterized protein n=1 Tax=Desulfoscipio gibsoniae DSM 7213 TaxID=767817 RepID=R4KN99_9FIRM|nr:hypothetical protein Desgi_1633 [Desulfoscipio gibsoniae DSM 7213]